MNSIKESKLIEKNKTAKKKGSILEFRDRDFAEYCEYVAAFKLQELGWKVYQPLSDRYIDIIALKEINNKFIFRTIQVKGSRLEKEGDQPSYGLTHKPKDLMHDPAHFFIWIFYDKEEKPNFIILSVDDFIKLMSNSFFKNISWRKGNCRMHFSVEDIKNKKLKIYLNNWENLVRGGNPNTFKLSNEAQETDNFWKTDKAISKWKETNLKVIKEISPEMLKRIKRKTEVEE